MADTQAALAADDAYAQALMRRHGVTGDDRADAREHHAAPFTPTSATSRVDRVLARRRRRCGRAAATGACTPAPATARRTRCSPPTACCWRETTCSPRISSNPIAHLPIGADPQATAASDDRPRPLLDYLASLEATAAADRGERILPGHGEPFTGAAQLIAHAHSP